MTPNEEKIEHPHPIRGVLAAIYFRIDTLAENTLMTGTRCRLCRSPGNV